ncbi:MAG: hypothetical protein AAGT88_05040, partial [Dethiobacter sp.]
RRPKRHRSRDAREREGEMIQMDASRFDWLSNGSYLHLHGAVDDANILNGKGIDAVSELV